MTEEKKIMSDITDSIKTIEYSTQDAISALHEFMFNLSGASYPRRLAMAILNIKDTTNILKQIEQKLTAHLLEHLAEKEEKDEK